MTINLHIDHLTVQLLAGETIGRWTILERSADKRYRYHFLCQCSCGNKKIVFGGSLKSRTSNSCGCWMPKLVSASRVTHGDSRPGRISAEYRILSGVIQRCTNPRNRRFKDYGKRGIRVCQEWRSSFVAFLEHVGRRPSALYSLDRINNDGNYEPGNVKWSTRMQQGNNKRNNIILVFGEDRHTVSEWARIKSIKPKTLHFRIANGWTVRDSLTTPIRAIGVVAA